VRFEYLAEVNMKISVLWDMTPFNLVESSQHFVEIVASRLRVEDTGRRFLRKKSYLLDFTASRPTR
jgi:hypothetical protein